MQASETQNWSEKELMSQRVGLLVHGMHLCILLISHQEMIPWLSLWPEHGMGDATLLQGSLGFQDEQQIQRTPSLLNKNEP